MAWRIDENQEIHSWVNKVNRISPTLGQSPPLGAVSCSTDETPSRSSTHSSPRTSCSKRRLEPGHVSGLFLHVNFSAIRPMPADKSDQTAASTCSRV